MTSTCTVCRPHIVYFWPRYPALPGPRPIGYADYEELGRGGLPITYHVGPGPATAHLKVESNWDLAPAYNVIATLEGRERPDQWVIRGNHHDGSMGPVTRSAGWLP
jgi:hypothetical protein